MTDLILTLNAGSSSIKFGLYRAAPEPDEIARGQVEALGAQARLLLSSQAGPEARPVRAPDHAAAVTQILGALAPHLKGRAIRGIGHRVVHGGPEIDTPRVIDAALIEDLEKLSPLAPLHQPHNLAGIRAAMAAFPSARQVACFDTAFHRGHPWVNDTFALPRRFYDQGVRRYGFHGLSYEFITDTLRRDFHNLSQGSVIIAHLGNGASLCAVRDGRSVGSTMGFSALDGMPMGTRSGQIDPGVILYLLDQGMSAAEITTLLYKQSGLKGLSGLSHDMRDLLDSNESSASEAIDYYVFRLGREIGAMAAVLGGVDSLVFTGGIGENSPEIRARGVERLGFLGLSVDPAANTANAPRIEAGTTPILVIKTDEERVIARATELRL